MVDSFRVSEEDALRKRRLKPEPDCFQRLAAARCQGGPDGAPLHD